MRFVYGVAGFVVGVALMVALRAVAASGLPAAMGPVVIEVAQTVPVMADVALETGEGVVTTTLPLTVEVALQVRIAGPLSVTVGSVSAPTVTARAELIPGPDVGKAQVDDLGLAYTLAVNSPELTVTEWTAYTNPDGRIEFAGAVALADEAEPLDEVTCVVRFYKAGKLVKVAEIVNVGYRLEPGGTNRFEGSTGLKPEAVDRYTVELEVVR